MSEKELKTQVKQPGSKKPIVESKVTKIIKTEKEVKKEEIAYLPKLAHPTSEFTLVIDLDETLVHYAEVTKFFNSPH